MNFAEKLKTLRKEKNITQGELAKKSGISLKTISRYEMGQTLPRSKKFFDKLSKVLGVTYDELVSPEDDFILNATRDFGSKGTADAKELVSGMIGLMAGGEIPKEDKKAILDAISEAYYLSKDENKKYTPKKYRENKEK